MMIVITIDDMIVLAIFMLSYNHPLQCMFHQEKMKAYPVSLESKANTTHFHPLLATVASGRISSCWAHCQHPHSLCQRCEGSHPFKAG